MKGDYHSSSLPLEVDQEKKNGFCVNHKILVTRNSVLYLWMWHTESMCILGPEQHIMHSQHWIIDVGEKHDQVMWARCLLQYSCNWAHSSCITHWWVIIKSINYNGFGFSNHCIINSISLFDKCQVLKY